jgi:hypothetical protein
VLWSDRYRRTPPLSASTRAGPEGDAPPGGASTALECDSPGVERDIGRRDRVMSPGSPGSGQLWPSDARGSPPP